MKKIILSVFVLLAGATQAFADPVMDRINKSGTIRCGYVSYSPASVKDAATGEMKGYTVDIVEEAARRMGLKIEWTYETNWPVMAADLQADKFDLGCVAYWSNPRIARQMLASDPLFYQPVFFIARADDPRFDGNSGKINDPSVSVAVLEGDVPETLLAELYPKSKKVALSQSASFSQLFQEVASRRADLTIASKPDMDEFAANNPGVLKVLTDQPVRLFSTVLQMSPGATQLKNALDVTIREMQLDGTVRLILKKYATSPYDYYLIQSIYSELDMDTATGAAADQGDLTGDGMGEGFGADAGAAPAAEPREEKPAE